MALIKCKECGNEISSEAKSCPKCGAPVPKKTSLFAWVIAGTIGFAVLSGIYNSNTSTPTQASARPAFTVDRSPAKQAERKKLVEKLIAQGLLQKVDMAGGNLPKMFIRPGFYNLDLDTKQSFASVIYAYYFDGSNISDTVILRDARTGKDVGTYNPNTGGLKLK